MDEIMLAAYKLCAIPININYRYVEDELIYLIDNADITHLFYQKTFEQLVTNIKPKLPFLSRCISMDASGEEDCLDVNIQNILDDSQEQLFSHQKEAVMIIHSLYWWNDRYPKGLCGVWRMS